MTRFLLDTSCMVPAVSFWHSQHQLAAVEIKRRIQIGEALVVAAHTLAEAYAVLTRMPPPNRLSASRAGAAIRESFVERAAEIVSLDSQTYVQLLGDASRNEIRGGTMYDLIIGTCASLGRVDVLLTFNERHFARLNLPGIEIVVPSL